MARIAQIAALLALGVAGPAAATTYVFDVTTEPGVANAFPTFHFELPDSPTQLEDLGYGFTIRDVATDGTSQYGPVSYVADYSFYTGTGLEAGFDDGTAYDSYYSEQLFDGGTAAPTFRPGSYALYDDPGAAKVATLVISATNVSPVPEPVAWVMMAAGFALAGSALRRRPRAAAHIA